ncbi:hypothetical protein [Streptomyces sp. Ac-502]|uniref:hypothetical protein n=1 Tax=Streptomyces sp. Ac-502 TaxID=3342801 RepID=UPI0038625784
MKDKAAAKKTQRSARDRQPAGESLADVVAYLLTLTQPRTADTGQAPGKLAAWRTVPGFTEMDADGRVDVRHVDRCAGPGSCVNACPGRYGTPRLKQRLANLVTSSHQVRQPLCGIEAEWGRAG